MFQALSDLGMGKQEAMETQIINQSEAMVESWRENCKQGPINVHAA